jgi:hypothetical protein
MMAHPEPGGRRRPGGPRLRRSGAASVLVETGLPDDRGVGLVEDGGVGLVEIPAEAAVDQGLAREQPQAAAEQARGQRRDQPLQARGDREGAAV